MGRTKDIFDEYGNYKYPDYSNTQYINYATTTGGKMEMTIDEAHRILSNGLVNAPSEHEWCMAFKMAVEIMSKYQKIEKIWGKWNIDMSVKTNVAMSQIGEVLKNGNED